MDECCPGCGNPVVNEGTVEVHLKGDDTYVISQTESHRHPPKLFVMVLQGPDGRRWHGDCVARILGRWMPMPAYLREPFLWTAPWDSSRSSAGYTFGEPPYGPGRAEFERAQRNSTERMAEEFRALGGLPLGEAIDRARGLFAPCPPQPLLVSNEIEEFHHWGRELTREEMDAKRLALNRGEPCDCLLCEAPPHVPPALPPAAGEEALSIEVTVREATRTCPLCRAACIEVDVAGQNTVSCTPCGWWSWDPHPDAEIHKCENCRRWTPCLLRTDRSGCQVWVCASGCE